MSETTPTPARIDRRLVGAPIQIDGRIVQPVARLRGRLGSGGDRKGGGAAGQFRLEPVEVIVRAYITGVTVPVDGGSSLGTNHGDSLPVFVTNPAVRARFDAYRADTRVVSLADDPFATEEATARIVGLFRNCRFDRCRVDPATIGVPKVGHFGFFRSRMRETLWPLVGDFLAT